MNGKTDILMFFAPESGHSEASLSGVTRHARGRGWRLHILRTDKPDEARAAMASFRPSGVLVGGRASISLHPSIFGTVPAVYLDHDPDPDGPESFGVPIFCVPQDSSETGRMAARELANLNLASYAYVPSRKPAYWDALRRNSFKSEIARRDPGKPVSVCPFRPSDSIGWHRRMGRWLMSLPLPTGVFAANDRIAWEVLHAAQQAGLKVPDDVALIGVDNELSVCVNATPGITSIAPDFAYGAEVAARLLDDRMADPGMAPVTRWFAPAAR